MSIEQKARYYDIIEMFGLDTSIDPFLMPSDPFRIAMHVGTLKNTAYGKTLEEVCERADDWLKGMGI